MRAEDRAVGAKLSLAIVLVADESAAAYALCRLLGGAYWLSVDVRPVDDAAQDLGNALFAVIYTADVDAARACCARYAGLRPSAPIIAIAPGAAGWQRAAILRAGADDVIGHEPEVEELLARIRAKLRRAGHLPPI